MTKRPYWRRKNYKRFGRFLRTLFRMRTRAGIKRGGDSLSFYINKKDYYTKRGEPARIPKEKPIWAPEREAP